MWIALGLVAVIALLFAGCSAMIAASSKSHTASNNDRFRGPTGVPGSRLHDGDFEFVVSGVSSPTNWRGEQPRREWIIATLTVHNADDESQ